MTFPILGGNSAVGGYAIDNSVRFNDNDSPYMIWTPSSSGDNTYIWTFSTWIKRCTTASTAVGYDSIFSCYDGSNYSINIAIGNGAFSGTGDYFEITYVNSSYAVQWGVRTNALLRDNSAWYNLQVKFDTTQATANNRITLYVNGEEASVTRTNSPSQNTSYLFNTTTAHNFGRYAKDSNSWFDGYFAETHFIDGQALSPTDFGEFDTDSGIWKPKQYTGTYGTNGFYLDFENSGSLGADQSGNGNNFTPTNLASTDQTTDTPTNNFATMNPLHSEGTTFSEGNLDILASTTFWNVATSTIPIPTSGKWYMEAKITAIQAAGHNTLGFLDANFPFTTNDTATAFTGGGSSWITYVYFHAATDNAYVNLADGSGYAFSNNTTFSAGVGDILMMAFDRDNNKIWFGKNGNWAKANGTTGANPSTGADATVSSISTDVTYMPNFGCGNSSARQQWNFGNPPYSISSGNSDENGYGNFEYAPPTGFLALCTQNLATALSPTIDDGSQYFNTVLYSGNNTAKSITGVGFQPDFIWNKNRSDVYNHYLNDSTRGVTKYLNSNNTGAEVTITQGITSFDSDGFTLGTDNSHNANATNLVAWNWKANGGTTSSNTDGSITSTVQTNGGGFSIVTFTGTGANGTFGHGLGAVPKFIIFKNRTDTSNWICYHEALGNTTGAYLNLTNANAGTSSAFFNNTTPTSSVVSVGVMNEGNGSGDNIVAYCFAEIEGYSKFGSYTGNGSTDGTFVYTGFRPAWVMIKVTDTAEDWWILDTTRDTFNSARRMLYADGISSEINVSEEIDFLSNGFKLRRSTTGRNGSGNSYIYMCFSANPFVTSSGVPVVAR